MFIHFKGSASAAVVQIHRFPTPFVSKHFRKQKIHSDGLGAFAKVCLLRKLNPSFTRCSAHFRHTASFFHPEWICGERSTELKTALDPAQSAGSKEADAFLENKENVLKCGSCVPYACFCSAAFALGLHYKKVRRICQNIFIKIQHIFQIYLFFIVKTAHK